MVYILGTNHKYSNKIIREKLSFSKGEILHFFDLLKFKRILEAVVLSTCNRIEIYFTGESKNVVDEVISIFEEVKKIKFSDFCNYFYLFEDRDVLRHLSEVASGIDSLIIGETEIKKQVIDAYLLSESYGMVNNILKNIFINSLKISKIVRRETKLNEGKVSVGSVTVEFLKEKLKTIKDKKFLIIGSGKVSETILYYLKKENCSLIFIGNRTYEKAKYLAEKFNGFAFKFDKLYEFLKICDICICSTSSPHFVIKKEKFSKRDKILIIIDLALPRDVDPEIGKIKNVFLYHLEDLNNIIEKNIEKRKIEAEKAKKIINDYVDRIWEREFIKLEQGQVILQ